MIVTPDRVGIAASTLTVEHVAHGENSLERIALGAARRRNISLAAGDPDAVVEDRVDGVGFESAGVIRDCDRPRTDGDVDHRGDFSFLRGIERIVYEFLEHDQRPIMDRVSGLILQFPLGAELHEP